MLNVTTGSLFALLAAVSAAPAAADTGCITMNTGRLPLSERRSPLDSVTFVVRDAPVKICYSRPSARGRTMIGGENVPYGELWRTGANEPTMIHTGVPLNIAGIRIPAGTFSLYTVPDERRWEVIVNRSIGQWGHERFYTEDLRGQEVGRASVPSELLDHHVEQFTIRAEPTPEGNVIVILEWERTRVMIPMSQG